MLATEFADAYLRSRIAVSEGYSNSIRRVVRRLCTHAGKPLHLAELSESLLCSYLASRALKVGPVTVNNERRILLTLCAAAADEGLCECIRARRVRRLTEPQPDPRAWTADEVAVLLRWTLHNLRGDLAGVDMAAWWASLFGVEFCTGARIGALMRLTPDAHDGHGLDVRESKTGKRRYCLLPAWLLGIMVKLPTTGERLWPWPHCYHTLFREARRIIEAAGLSAPKSGRQLFYRLRRSHLSYCAATSMELAQQQAGHTSPRTTARYIDPRIVASQSVLAALPELRIA